MNDIHNLAPELIPLDANVIVERNLEGAIAILDRKFGEGFASKHPELAVALAQGAANISATTVVAREISKLRVYVADALAGFPQRAD